MKRDRHERMSSASSFQAEEGTPEEEESNNGRVDQLTMDRSFFPHIYCVASAVVSNFLDVLSVWSVDPAA